MGDAANMITVAAEADGGGVGFLVKVGGGVAVLSTTNRLQRCKYARPRRTCLGGYGGQGLVGSIRI